jgi:hypothetical protein
VLISGWVQLLKLLLPHHSSYQAVMFQKVVSCYFHLHFTTTPVSLLNPEKATEQNCWMNPEKVVSYFPYHSENSIVEPWLLILGSYFISSKSRFTGIQVQI